MASIEHHFTRLRWLENFIDGLISYDTYSPVKKESCKMNRLYTRIHVSLLTAVLLLAWAPLGHTAVILSNIQLTETTLSFDIAGTIDVVGDISTNNLFIGDPWNSTWVSKTNVYGTWTSSPGTYQPASVTTGAIPNIGGYIVTNPSAGNDITVGTTIDATVSFTSASDTLFIPENTDPLNWIVSAGYSDSSNPVLPDPSVSTGSAIPEPGSFAIICLGTFLITRRRRVA